MLRHGGKIELRKNCCGGWGWGVERGLERKRKEKSEVESFGVDFIVGVGTSGSGWNVKEKVLVEWIEIFWKEKKKCYF